MKEALQENRATADHDDDAGGCDGRAERQRALEQPSPAIGPAIRTLYKEPDDDAENTRQQDDRQPLLPAEVKTRDEEQLEVAATHGFAPEHPIGNEHYHNKRHPDGACAEHVIPDCPKIQPAEGQRCRQLHDAHGKRRQYATVWDTPLAQIDKRRVQQDAREGDQLDGLERKPVNYRHCNGNHSADDQCYGVIHLQHERRYG